MRHLDLRLKIILDKGFRQRVGHLCRQLSIVGTKADLYQLAVTNRLDLQVAHKVINDTFSHLFFAHRFARFKPINWVEQLQAIAGLRLAWVILRVSGEFEFFDNFACEFTRLDDLNLRLVVLAITAAHRVIDLFNRNNFGFALFNHHHRGGAIQRPHRKHDQRGNQRNQHHQPQNAPFAFVNRTPVLNKIECLIFSFCLQCRTKASVQPPMGGA